MHIDLKLEHAHRVMNQLHERHARMGEDLKRLCAILTDLATEHAEACGADSEVTAAVIAPKDDPKP